MQDIEFFQVRWLVSPPRLVCREASVTACQMHTSRALVETGFFNHNTLIAEMRAVGCKVMLDQFDAFQMFLTVAWFIGGKSALNVDQTGIGGATHHLEPSVSAMLTPTSRAPFQASCCVRTC